MAIPALYKDGSWIYELHDERDRSIVMNKVYAWCERPPVPPQPKLGLSDVFKYVYEN